MRWRDGAINQGQFCVANQEYKKNKSTICSTLKAMQDFENEYPEIAKRYFDVRMEDVKHLGKE